MVKKYICVTRYPETGQPYGSMEPRPDGDYVLASTYDLLEARFKEMEDKVEELRSKLASEYSLQEQYTKKVREVATRIRKAAQEL